MKRTVALIFSLDTQRQVISPALRERMARMFNVVSPVADGKVTPEVAAEFLREADGCMSGWGSPNLSAEVLAKAPKLRIMAHSAGSVKPFVSDKLFERGIVVTSASAQIAVDVAHFTLGLIIIGQKDLMELSPRVAHGEFWGIKGGYRPANDPRGCTVGVISASHVGRCVLKLLPHFEMNALLYDPYVSAEQARALQAEKVELDELFERSDVVSCHAPSIPATQHIVNAARLAKMRDGAVFINTARGSCVDEHALVEELKKRRIWAFLDVFDPEPPPPGSPLFTCPNLTMTPHMAGCVGRGRLRLGEQACSELEAYFAGKPAQYPVTKEMLDRIA
ncbi:MAG: hydroxyacid dehydrogenase [Planctomycetota bacterium]|nr:hydroxyacid dehydrogenase [Planctomycetota bacterium]